MLLDAKRTPSLMGKGQRFSQRLKDLGGTFLPYGYYSAMALGATLYAANINKKAAKSVDGGLTWTDFAKVFPNDLHSVFPTSSGILLASSISEIHRSTDDGANWAKVFDTSDVASYVSTWAWAENSDGDLFAGEYSNAVKCPYVWISENDGADWTRIDDLFALTNKHVHHVFVDPETDRLYTTIGDTPKDTYYSDNNGGDWTEIFDGQGQTGFTGITSTSSARFFADDLASSNKIWKSTDDSALTELYAASNSYDEPFFEIVNVHNSNKLFAISFNQNQVAGKSASILYSPDAGSTWSIILDSPTGGYKFNRSAIDWRHRVPEELGYFICNCVSDRQMLRIPVNL